MGNSVLGKTIVYLFVSASLISLGRTLPAADLRIETDANTAINTMRGGIGASWHAIGDLQSIENHGGSAWVKWPRDFRREPLCTRKKTGQVKA